MAVELLFKPNETLATQNEFYKALGNKDIFIAARSATKMLEEGLIPREEVMTAIQKLYNLMATDHSMPFLFRRYVTPTTKGFQQTFSLDPRDPQYNQNDLRSIVFYTEESDFGLTGKIPSKVIDMRIQNFSSTN